MARVCDICGKRTTVGNNVSHSHNLSKRKIYPNLQKVNALVNGKTTRITVCTTCIKSGKVIKPAKKVLI
jgi:large subunit ribosomal protein L28